MNKALRFLAFFTISLVFAQESSEYVSKISSEDSLTIVSLRNSMARNINPNPDSAFYYSRKIKEFSTKKKYAIGIVDADYLIGVCFKRTQQNDSAIVHFKKALHISELINYPLGKARAYSSLCRTYYLLGEMDESIKAGQNALSFVDTNSPPSTLIFAETHIALATAYARQNKLQEALKILLVVDSLHNKQALRPDVIAAAYQSLGGIYLDLEEYDSAENYYLKANDEFNKLPGDVSYYLNTTNINLGRVYSYKEDLHKADSLLTMAHTFFSAIKDERTLGEISTYLGQVKVKSKMFSEAESFFKEGLAIHKKNQRNYEASLNAIELAKLALKKKDAVLAIRFLKEADDLNQNGNNSLVSQETNFLFAKSYGLSGDYKKAFLYSENATRIKDSLQKIQSSEKIKEIEAIYQTESRDREIELLTSQNELVESQKKNQRNILLGGLGLTALAGLFFFFLYNNRQKTNNKLKEVDRAKSTFFANISHEFRTPLTLIKGPLEDQLSQDDLSRGNRKNLLIAHRNSNRLEKLVEQLLALSKLESGHFNLQVEPGNLPKFLLAQADTFSFSSQEKDIEYRVNVEPDEHIDWFDKDAVEKMLFNLIGNALKYTPENGSIEISGNRYDGSYKIILRNSADSFSAEQLNKLFDRFYKTDTKSTGTGIGLALTKELAELHHGSVSVAKEESGMIQFTLDINTAKNTFSASEIISEEIQATENPKASDSEEINDGQLFVPEDAPILLIVDDSQDIRDYTTSIFESIYDVHGASNGQEGFEKALKLIPDIIISDVMMPIEDGLTLTKNLKEHELTAHIPVILLTAKSDVSDKLDGMEVGADSYITKPFNSQLVKASAENLIENRRKLQQRFSQEVILTPKEIAISSADEQFLVRLEKVLDENITNSDFSVEGFSKAMNVSRMQLHRKIKALTGQSASEFLRSQRLKMAAKLLRDKKISISEVGYSVGFSDPSYFTRCFKQEFGCAPSEYSSK